MFAADEDRESRNGCDCDPDRRSSRRITVARGASSSLDLAVVLSGSYDRDDRIRERPGV